MQFVQKFACGAACVLAMSVLLQSGAQAQAAPGQGQQQRQGAAPQRTAPQPTFALAAKPVTNTAYTGVHKPHTKLADVLAAHRGQQSWTQTVVDDEFLKAQWISMAPGESTPMRMQADTKAWWIIQDGQVRFTIAGQEPFVASKGWLVQVPFQTMYKMETVGNVPSLRFEVYPQLTSFLYAETETPPSVAGINWTRVRVPTARGYAEGERPFLNFADVQSGAARPGAFVSDARGFANIIRGNPPQNKPTAQNPNPTDLGHFHLEYAEFWLVMEGQIDYLIEGLPFFTADVGDVVYVPNGRFHRASHGGTGFSTRLALNGFPSGLHNYAAPPVAPAR